MHIKPDFLIIGVQKSGTSSLFEYLGRHPDIVLPSEKELHYFDLNYSHGSSWYRKKFPRKLWFKRKITGEASPYYIFHPLAPSRIRKFHPGIKLLVLLRNPVLRAYSHYQMQRNRKFEMSEFEEALKNEEQQIHLEERKIIENPGYNSLFHQRNSYLSRGCYYDQITHWLSLFPKNQFLFIKSEDFFSNTKEELESVYKFLEIANNPPKNLKPFNTGNYSPAELDVETFQTLNSYFQEKNKKLPELIGNKFQW